MLDNHNTFFCREALAKLRAGDVPIASLDRRAVDELRRRGLAIEHIGGYVRATSRAAGYCASPATFEAAEGVES